MRSLVAITALGLGLAGYNAWSLSRDIAVATGPHSDAQHDFFLSAADRPDIELFYKRLSSAQRLAMAMRIGEYDDEKLATLIGTLLGTFDTEARGVLTQDLTTIGRRHPGPVASQLKQTGSLQLLAITTALRAIGNADLPDVAAQLRVVDARPNAIAYLVSAGRPAVSLILPYLQDPDKDVRLAAADALGKIGDHQAVPNLLVLYNQSAGDEKFGYLSAIAAIGAPETERLLATEATDPALSTPRRAQAMLGLGRIGSPSAVAKLWSFAGDDDAQVREAMISGLQLAGDAALRGAAKPELGLRVAAGVKTPEANAYIARMLSDPPTISAAAEASTARPQLVLPLVASLARTQDGTSIDAVMRALTSTPAGVAELKRLERDPRLGGFAMRRLRLISE